MNRFKYTLAMAIFGTIGIFVRYIPLASQEIVFYRALIAVIFLLAIIIFGKKGLHVHKKELGWLILSGICMAADWMLFFESFKHTTVPLATLSYYFAPILVVVGSAVFFKERLRPGNIICFVCATAGLVLIIGMSGGRGSNDLLGIICALAAAVFYTLIVLINKKAPKTGNIDRTFVQFAATAVVLVPYIAATSGFNIGTLSAKSGVFLLLLGVLHSGICYVLYFSTIKHIPGQQVAILAYADPLVAVIGSAIVLGEVLTPLQYVGGAVILVFACLNQLELKTPPFLDRKG